MPTLFVFYSLADKGTFSDPTKLELVPLECILNWEDWKSQLQHWNQ